MAPILNPIPAKFELFVTFYLKLKMSCSATRKKLCGIIECSICYNRSFAMHPKSQFWSSKNELEPYEVFKCSNKKYWFDCTDCGHEIQLQLGNIINGQWCSYCNKDKLCNSNNCNFCFNKSFASHPMANGWSSKNELSARNISKSSDSKYWFDCINCNHSFEARLYSIKNENHCPYCTNQKLCDNECQLCFNKSCASHQMSKAWSDKNEIIPRMMFLQSNKKCIFNCLKCNHEYETTIHHYYNRDGSCPYCANKYLCQDDNCKSCFIKSFASHPLVSCWSSKNNISPRSIFKGSESKGIFNCNVCNSEFESKMYNVLTGYWCPYCKNKSEAKLLQFLNKYNCKTQVRFDWCRFSKTNNIMPFDFELMNDKILIELDGEQHFSQVSNWDAPELIQEKDVEKIKKCIENGYSIIHINQEEMWKDKYDWKHILQDNIEHLKNTDNKQVLFISRANKYSSHIEKLNNIHYKLIQP